jgi:hypothetical protein
MLTGPAHPVSADYRAVEDRDGVPGPGGQHRLQAGDRGGEQVNGLDNVPVGGGCAYAEGDRQMGVRVAAAQMDQDQ